MTDAVYLSGPTFKSLIHENSLGFAYNAQRNVLPQMEQWIQDFKFGSNPPGTPVAAVQADIVGHSMGGVIARTLVLQPGFLGSNTYGQGVIHKLITIDTPHLGSPLAIQLLSSQETGGCLQRLLAGKGNVAIKSTLVSGNPTAVTGAVLDLQADDTMTPNPLSGALSALTSSSPHPIPFSSIVGIYQNWNSLSGGSAAGIRDLCFSDPLAQMLNPTSYPTIFRKNNNDGLVSENSQIAGLPNPFPFSVFNGYEHSPGLDGLGFMRPSVLDGTAIPTQVISLLNTSWKNSLYYAIIKP